MELSKNYMPSEVEAKWYEHWLDKGYFNSRPDERPPFTVVIPPPNVTGVLHMGHTLNETVQDILIRKARMEGFNACWVPGTDHASIATEAKVVGMLKERGIEKSSLSRPEFMEYAYEWKEKYGGIIYTQIKKLGCSVDWDRVSFTMDAGYYTAVIRVFIDLYQKGLIYRGARMINWDPQAKTALSDEEVEYKDVQGKLYYVGYRIVNADGSEFQGPLPTLPGSSAGPAAGSAIPALDGHIVIATQRPETIMGDTGICVNPADERYKGLAGKFAIVPLVNRKVPFVFDEYVDPAFGTGALKVTPAHDINDYNLGLKHSLPVIDTLNEDGTLSAAAGVFVGMDRFAARKKVVEQLKAEGLLLREEEYLTRLGYSERTHAVVEPRISTQWFVKMKEMAGPALKTVTEGSIRLHPGDRFMATYKYWLENVEDWCISRQLWWGQQIPAWYAPDGSFRVAATREEAFDQWSMVNDQSDPKDSTHHLPFTIDELRQDEDVLDTWFSSWLWPIEVFKGITHPGNPDISYYYPTSVLVTAPEIIFFWVARMIMAGFEYLGEKPFSEVYFTGIVRDKQGRKMSKSLGNSPDLLELIDKYGADAVRFGVMIASPAGNDIIFDEAALEQGRNFNNKLWNALKLVKMWETRISPGQSQDIDFATEWFEARLNDVKKEINKLFSDFRLNEALKTLYSLIWDDFCSWYLEWVKPDFEQPINQLIYEKTVSFFEQLMQLLHPFMPFITEDIYHLLCKRQDDLCIKQFEPIKELHSDIREIELTNISIQLIQKIREFRNKVGLKRNHRINIHAANSNFKGADLNPRIRIENAILTEESIHDDDDSSKKIGLEPVLIETYKFYFDLGNLGENFKGAIKTQIIKDLERLKSFLGSIDKKLSNEKFVQNAKPEVLAFEEKKKADAEAKIKVLEESLATL